MKFVLNKKNVIYNSTQTINAYLEKLGYEHAFQPYTYSICTFSRGSREPPYTIYIDSYQPTFYRVKKIIIFDFVYFYYMILHKNSSTIICSAVWNLCWIYDYNFKAFNLKIKISKQWFTLFLNLNIFVAWWCKPLIFQTYKLRLFDLREFIVWNV